MRHEDGFAAVGDDFFDRGQCGDDAFVVGHLQVGGEGHIEIDAHQDAFSLHLQVIDG